MTRQLPWVRVILEGVAIVASILLAFAIDASWQRRQQRIVESEALEQLAIDLAQVDEVLVAWQANHMTVLESSVVLLGHTGPAGRRTLSLDSLAALLWNTTTAFTIALPDPTLSSFESSGRLGLLRNPELRSALADWRAAMVDLQEDEKAHLEFAASELTLFLNARASQRTISHFARAPFLDMPSLTDSIPPSDFDDGLFALLSSREFENLLELVRLAEAGTVGNYDLARARLDQVRRLIEDELGRRP